MKTLTECREDLRNIRNEFSDRYCDTLNPTCTDCPFVLGANKPCIYDLLRDCWDDLDTAIIRIKENI